MNHHVVPRQLRLRRADLVVEDPFDKLIAFFRKWPQYDAYVASGDSPPNQIVPKDVDVIYSTMGSRASRASWQPLIDRGSLPELRAIDPGIDLYLTTQRLWVETRTQERLHSLFDAMRGKGIGIANATKLLYIKRPRLIPVCDSFVLNLFDLPAGEMASGIALISALRSRRTQWTPLLRDIQLRLKRSPDHIERTLVRIGDALMWSVWKDVKNRAKQGLLQPP